VARCLRTFAPIHHLHLLGTFTVQKDAEQSIYDFDQIMIGSDHRTITANDYIKLFKKYHQNIMQFKDQDNVIVITHFPFSLS
jgi:hypothetical protein